MPRIYFGTEFTGLYDDAKLISIGLINATTKDCFYREVGDGYAIAHCRDFCKEHVIPLLEDGELRIPAQQLVLDLKT